MKAAIYYGEGHVEIGQRPDPRVVDPTDAVVRVVQASVCGSDLWPYRGADPVDGPISMAHEYVGIVEEVGAAVTMIRPG